MVPSKTKELMPSAPLSHTSVFSPSPRSSSPDSVVRPMNHCHAIPSLLTRQYDTLLQGTSSDISCSAWLTIVPVVPWKGPHAARGPRSTAKFFPRGFDVWTFSVGLNVTTTKKGRQLFGGRKVHPQRSTRRENPGYAYMRKGPRFTLVWGPRHVSVT